MQLNYFKNSKFLLFISLSILFWAAPAQAGSNIGVKANTKVSKTAPNLALDLNLMLSRKLAAKREAQSFDSELNSEDLELLPTEILPLHNQSLIAKSFSGQASWYGPGFHGRLTANGERYNQNALTAAHKYLRFGTRVRVTNLNNGRSVILRINDRGPYAGGRVIDVSAAAAQTLGMIHSGVAPVKVTILGR